MSDWTYKIARDSVVAEYRKAVNKNANRCELAEIRARRLAEILDDLLDLYGPVRRQHWPNDESFEYALEKTRAAEEAVHSILRKECPYEAWGRKYD